MLAGSYYAGKSAFEQWLRGPLLPVAQLPIVCYPLAWLRDGGVTVAAVCANSSTPGVARALGDGGALGMTLRYVTEADPRGPAGCARDAAMAAPVAETFVVVEGAMIPSLDLVALLAAHARSGAAATTVVEVDRRRNAVGARRPTTPGGIYVFARRVLEAVPAAGFQDIKQGLLERLYAAGERVHLHEVQGISPRVLDYRSYAAVSGWLIGLAATRPEFRDYRPIAEGLRHPSAVVDPAATVIGPVLLGPGARIAAGAVIVGPASIGADSQVGPDALVARSSVWERCRVGAGAVVDGALLAHGVAVAAEEQLMGAVEVIDTAGHPADVLAVPTFPWDARPAGDDASGGVRAPRGFSLLADAPAPASRPAA